MTQLKKPEFAIAAAAAIFAAVAALASTVQAYVSWTGRSDLARANLATILASHCLESIKSVNQMAAYYSLGPNRSESDYLRDVRATNDGMNVYLRAITSGMVRVGQLKRGPWDEYWRARADLDKSISEALSNVEKKLSNDMTAVQNSVRKLAPAVVNLCEGSQFVPDE